MAHSDNSFRLGVVPEATLTFGRGVAPGSGTYTDGNVGGNLPAAANARLLGVCERGSVLNGDLASLVVAGECRVEVDGAYSAFDRINAADSTGKFKKALSSYTSNLTGATNNDFVLSAVDQGRAGDEITFEMIDPGGTSATLSVKVTARHIAVTLGRASSAINTTAHALRDLLAADPLASALVTYADKTGNDGTGLVAALAPVRLSGGAHDVGYLLEATTTTGDQPRAILDRCN